MNKHLIHKNLNRVQRKRRIRSVVSGTAERPRLSVYISNQHVTAQLIDDVAGRTLGHASTVGKKQLKGSLGDKAMTIGSDIAKQAKQKKINEVVFDRGGKLYHGRVAKLADAARKEGLEF